MLRYACGSIGVGKSWGTKSVAEAKKIGSTATGNDGPNPGAAAAAAFQQHVNNGHGDLDKSSICKLIDPEVK